MTADPRQASVDYQDCLVESDRAADLRLQIEVRLQLAESIRFEDERRSIAYLEEILAITEPLNEHFYRSYALWGLGVAAWRQADMQRAARLLIQSLLLKHQVHELLGESRCLESLAWVAAGQRDHGRAATLLGAARAIADANGAPMTTAPHLASEHEECQRLVHSALGEEAFESAFEAGFEMGLEAAIQYATKQTVDPLTLNIEHRVQQRKQEGGDGAAVERQTPVVRVLIVNRYRVVADGIRLVLEEQPDLRVVGIATNAGDAVQLASETQPNVILADYQMPESNGAELAARLRKRLPLAQVLLLSSVVNSPLLQEAVKAGARGFLLKTQPAAELADAVRRVAAGEMLIPASRLAVLITGSEKEAQLLDLLTRREREVLQLLAAGLDNRRIASRLGIGYVTVRSHLRNLLSKFDARSRLEVLAKASELGLIER
jgi:DNA-binding NarL/FixJ family response regulator